MTSIRLFVECFLVFLVVIDISAAELFQQCKVSDDACITKSAKEVFPIIASGIPELGVNTSDPLFVEEIKGDLSVLKFTLTDSTVTGFKNCDINNIKINMEKMMLHANFTCLNIAMEGKYVIGGRLIILPIEGTGTYFIKSKKYQIGVDAKLKTVKGTDEKDHLQIKTFKLDLHAEDGIAYDFTNLFNGQKDLADAVLKFANENWKEVADFVQGPVINGDVKKIVSNFNKYLRTVPLESLFI